MRSFEEEASKYTSTKYEAGCEFWRGEIAPFFYVMCTTRKERFLAALGKTV